MMNGNGNDIETDIASLVPMGREPWPGVISAGQPRGHEWQALAEAGVETVVDIREAWEPRGHDEAAAVEAAGLRYVHIPLGNRRIEDETFARIREVVRERGDAPIVVHCASGNRVGGALLPYWLLDEGLGEEEALQTAVKAGLASRPLAGVAVDYARRQTRAREAAA
jgi:uncharacterized protein (TIGR01244 family)